MTIEEFLESKDKLAIHCDTEEKAKKLLKAFNKLDCRWVDDTSWEFEEDETCYSNGGCDGSVEYFKQCDYTIIEFDEIEFEDSSLKSCAEKIQSVADKEEKGPQSMKEEKKAIEETLKKCASFFGITNCICTYTYEYSDNKITIYTDKPGLWIGYYGNGSTILRAALSMALHKDGVEVAFIELKGFMAGSIKIGE